MTRAAAQPLRCCDLWQRYKKKAIHNHQRFGLSALKVLWPMTKIQKESNSQPASRSWWCDYWCCDLWQRYKKKAIHNRYQNTTVQNTGVVTYDKDTKRKQFTTLLPSLQPFQRVLWPMTKIQKESNSQRGATDECQRDWCCDLWQRYKKKAIHNTFAKSPTVSEVLWPMTKIQKESNSQPASHCRIVRKGVVTYDKDTKRKQFTTLFLSLLL